MLGVAERCDDGSRQQRQREYLKQWRERNRDIYRSFGKAHYEAERDNILARQYGLTPEAVRALRRANGGKCAICGIAPDGTPTGARLQIDHDHATGVVRDLLCGKCNTGIAMFRENLEALQAAVQYLHGHRTRPRTEEMWRVLSATHPDPVTASASTNLEWWQRETNNIRKTAELCGVSTRTVRNWVRDNAVEYALTPSGKVRIFVDSLLRRPREDGCPVRAASTAAGRSSR